MEENRTTWLLFALIALAGSLAAEEPEELAACFPVLRPIAILPHFRAAVDLRTAEVRPCSSMPQPAHRRACSRAQRQSPHLSSAAALGGRGGNPGQARRHSQRDSLSPASMAAPTPWMPFLRRRSFPGLLINLISESMNQALVSYADPGEGTGGPRARTAIALELDVVDVRAAERWPRH